MPELVMLLQELWLVGKEVENHVHMYCFVTNLHWGLSVQGDCIILVLEWVLSSGLSIHPVLDGVPDGWSLLFVNIHSYMYIDPCRDTAHTCIWAEGFFFEDIVKNYVCVLFVMCLYYIYCVLVLHLLCACIASTVCLYCIYYVFVLLTSVVVDTY